MDARPALQPNIIEGSSFLGRIEAKPGRWWTGIISSLALVSEYLRINQQIYYQIFHCCSKKRFFNWDLHYMSKYRSSFDKPIQLGGQLHSNKQSGKGFYIIMCLCLYVRVEEEGVENFRFGLSQNQKPLRIIW